jgi:fused-like protein
MNEMLHQDPQQAAFILQKFSQPNTLQLIKDLIDLRQAKRGNINLINGINFGCPYEGFYDHPIIFFESIAQQYLKDNRTNRDRKAEFLSTLSQVKLDEQLMQFLMNISSKSDLSPSGFNKILLFVHDMVAHEQKEFMQKIFKNCMKLLCSMMRDNQLLSIQEWPVKCGGGT